MMRIVVKQHNPTTFYQSFIANPIPLSIAKVIIGAIAIFASAQIAIPIKPVPITLHTVMISIIAFTYTPRLGFITVLTYIMAGILGLPMFSKFSGGLHYFMGATFGYLIGMLIATPIMSILSIKLSSKFFGVFLSCLAGHVIIYLFGMSWLTTIIGVKQALYSGVIVYIPTGMAKILIFSYLYSYLKGRNVRYLG